MAALPPVDAATEVVMARGKSRPVHLSEHDRELLTAVVRTGASPAQQVRRARVLLELDEDRPDRPSGVPTQAVVAERAGVSVATVAQVAALFAERGGDVEAVITRKKRLTPPVPPKVTGEVEAAIIAMACQAPPPGFTRWSLRLLERHVALVEELPNLDHSTIGHILRKHHFGLT